MALKPTIYKCRIDLSDLNRDRYDTLNLTLAQHPSETTERMMVRLLAFCLNAQDNLVFSKDLSSPEEPDLWVHSLDGNLETWIDVGEPAPERIKKASRVARTVKVYSFNSKADTWWAQNKQALQQGNAEFFQFDWESVQGLARLVERTMDWSVTLSEQSVYVSTAAGDCEVTWQVLS